MKETILDSLALLFHEQQITLLYAVECGSRAWGYNHPGSDYDIRFLYVRKPEAYFKINPPSDYLEYKSFLPNGEMFDIVGWDIRKALSLLKANNIQMHEWLNSPTVYLEASPLIERIRLEAYKRYSPLKVWYQYRQQGMQNQGRYVEKAFNSRKTMVVLREVLSLRYLEQHGDHPMPDLLTLASSVALPERIHVIVEECVLAAMSGDVEHGCWRRISTWLSGELLKRHGKPPEGLIDIVNHEDASLDALLLEALAYTHTDAE